MRAMPMALDETSPAGTRVERLDATLIVRASTARPATP